VRHVYECQLRRADLHPGGTVDNVMFVDYLQEARLDLLRHHDTSPTPAPGEGLVVVRTVVDYRTPLRLSDAPLYVAVWVTEVRAATFTLGYELVTRPQSEAGSQGESVVHAHATTVLTPFVFAENRPRRLTPSERERLLPGLERSPLDDERRTRPAGWSERGVQRRPVHVRFSDVDVLGHVNNVRYVDYVQDAHIDLMVGVFVEASVKGRIDMVVARTEIDYLGQMSLRPEPYEVWTRVSAVGSASLTLESEIRDGDRVMARARVVEVNLDEDGKPTSLLPTHRELFARRVREAAIG
jgi:acyl-CoA thioester hydrolase